ncbi:MAG: YecA/YgfB family protein [Pseudomonadaceae bacterium]
MSIQNSPYAAFATLLSGSAQTVSPAELHGLLLGRSCAGADFAVEPWLADAADLLGEMPEGSVRQALIGLQEMVKGELAGEDIAVVLLLPNDDAPLTERAVALGQWCQGFLAGFGLVAGDRALSAEAMEVLQDLSAIAQIQDALEESEEGESDYMEVMEYLRVAPVLLFAECAKPLAPAAKPSLH